ncbi:MAG: hemerythrin family protein, partial [Spirochaetaceae bacterium]|nr:hemerythrin family protein [Spirochaetaceae bacterium]
KIIKRVSQSHNDHISIDLLSNYIEEILLYARFHFCSEENLMVLNNYPRSESHKELHNELIRALADMISMYRINKIERDDILSFLVEWFVEHTTKEDMKMAEYLKKQ